MKDDQAQKGMDFPHDLPRQGKPYVQQRLTPSKLTKKDRKRIAALQRSLREKAA